MSGFRGSSLKETEAVLSESYSSGPIPHFIDVEFQNRPLQDNRFPIILKRAVFVLSSGDAFVWQAK